MRVWGLVFRVEGHAHTDSGMLDLMCGRTRTRQPSKETGVRSSLLSKIKSLLSKIPKQGIVFGLLCMTWGGRLLAQTSGEAKARNYLSKTSGRTWSQVPSKQAYQARPGNLVPEAISLCEALPGTVAPMAGDLRPLRN